jgi:hypothetical protein
MAKHEVKYAGVEQALADEINNIDTDYENLGRIEGLAIALGILNDEDSEPEMERVATEHGLTGKLQAAEDRLF